MLAQSESLFALSNGYIGWRGNLEEGEPHGLPGCYVNGVYELHPLPYAEAGYGYPESGQTLINVTDGKLIRLMVDDEQLDLRHGQTHSHERVLDLRSGLLHRTREWTSPVGKTVRIRSTRLVSFTHRVIAAIAYEVQPLDDEVQLVIQSELVANEPVPHLSGDPRAAAALESPLQPEEHSARGYTSPAPSLLRATGERMARCAGALAAAEKRLGDAGADRPDQGAYRVVINGRLG